MNPFQTLIHLKKINLVLLIILNKTKIKNLKIIIGNILVKTIRIIFLRTDFICIYLKLYL